MERQATIKDIARTLNISTSTVSRALRNTHDVKIETRKAVMELAEQLNYQPNQLALHLLKKQTHTIGVIIPNLDYVVSTMVKGIDEMALEAGYTVMVCQSNESYGREIVNTKRLMDSLVDGFIISQSGETNIIDHFKKLQEKKKPMVLFDRIASGMKAPKVRIDNEEAGYLATKHLIEQGYKKIAILCGPESLELSNNRKEGYLKALKEHGMKVDKNLIIYCDFNQDYAYFATKELLVMRSRPDAIFAIADKMAIGAMLAIKEKKLTMPNDIGLVGMNNDPTTRLVTPTISSVEMPAFELGKTAAKMFIEMMNSDKDMTNEEIVLRPKLIIRESSTKMINTSK